MSLLVEDDVENQENHSLEQRPSIIPGLTNMHGRNLINYVLMTASITNYLSSTGFTVEFDYLGLHYEFDGLSLDTAVQQVSNSEGIAVIWDIIGLEDATDFDVEYVNEGFQMIWGDILQNGLVQGPTSSSNTGTQTGSGVWLTT